MLVRVPVASAGPAGGLAWLPPALALAGMLACSLPAWLRLVLVLACMLRWWRACRSARGAGTPPPAVQQVDLSAAGILCARGAGRAALLLPGGACRVDAGGVRLALPGQPALALPQPGQARAARALARALLQQPTQRTPWQAVLPRAALRRRPAPRQDWL